MELKEIVSSIKDKSAALIKEFELAPIIKELEDFDKEISARVDAGFTKKYPDKVKKAKELFTYLTTDLKPIVWKGNLADHIYEYKEWFNFAYANIVEKKLNEGGYDPFQGKDLWKHGYKNVAANRKMNAGVAGNRLRMYYAFSKDLNSVIQKDLITALTHPEQCVLICSGVPAEPIRAMGLTPFTLELVAKLTRTEDQRGPIKYLDKCEEAGVAIDTCSFPKMQAGAALDGQYFDGFACAVFSNIACDSAMASYALIEEKLNIPTFRLDQPYQFKTEQGITAFKEELYEMIDFIHDTTGAEMDWDLLAKIVKNLNYLQELDLERFELNASTCPPFDASMMIGQHIVARHSAYAGLEEVITAMENQLEFARDAYARGESAYPNMKYRAILWNPPPGVYTDFHVWAERCWGIGILTDMETYGFTGFIDESSNDSMLYGLSEKELWGPMSHHTRGPMDNFFGTLWKAVEQYRPDLVIVADHVGCHPVTTIHGLLKEECQRKNVPLCIMNQDLADIRVVSKQGMRDQINDFMFNVMNAEPLDPSLLSFDDSEEW